MFKSEVGVEASEDVSAEVLSELENHLVLNGLKLSINIWDKGQKRMRYILIN
jgi:hypothetical protein